ncbi:recombination mediator RecR [Ileibacterium valens]|uniref:recombination mediator RecR n=1 Tax=Ileibacterium valens TaxID=1862668 RepID=UPI00272B0CEF|nr:recombination mediator RecR [Ileibacterium valens]
MYPDKFEDVMYAFHRLPGVGMKTAERYAYEVMNWEPEVLDQFLKALNGIKKVKRCKICGNLSDQDICSICSDDHRNHAQICVVANSKDISAIENMQSYDGTYHVLNGVINTAKGILPDHLNIDSLMNRIDGTVNEVILALDPNIEGETTSLYLSKLLEDKVEVSQLASGIPVGSHLEYADRRTLARAFEGRRKSKSE